MRDVNATNNAKKAIDLNIKAIDAAIAIGFYNNYLMDSGLLDWNGYTTDLVKATANTHLSTLFLSSMCPYMPENNGVDKCAYMLSTLCS